MRKKSLGWRHYSNSKQFTAKTESEASVNVLFLVKKCYFSPDICHINQTSPDKCPDSSYLKSK